MNVVLVFSFLVGQKSDLNSTIWGMQKTEYNDWISRTEEKFRKMMAENTR